MTMEALPAIGEALKVVAADLELTTTRTERGWEAFAKAAGTKFGDAGFSAAVRLRTHQEQIELVSKRGADAREWSASSAFREDVSRITDRANRSEDWASGQASTS